MIYRKTAKLFEAGDAARRDPRGPGRDARGRRSSSYGRHLGPHSSSSTTRSTTTRHAEELGKNIGDDLAEGKPTLPLIYAMAHGSAAERHMIREAIETGGTRNLTSIQLAIETSGGLRYTAERAREEVEVAIKALAPLPPSKYRDALAELAQFAIRRRY